MQASGNMRDTAAELMNVCDESPRRPAKRMRPEVLEQKVFSLLDSEGRLVVGLRRVESCGALSLVMLWL